jgi:hypothetical protein
MVLVNGPPGIGKSALTALYVSEHPLTLNLDIDLIRRQLGGWRDDGRSKKLARDLAKEMAGTHLRNGCDEVIPQLVMEPPFISELGVIAAENGASFVEVLLMGSDESVLARFRARQAELTARGEAHPAEAIELGTESEILAEMRAKLLAMAATRPTIHVIQTADGRVDEALRLLTQCLHA